MSTFNMPGAEKFMSKMFRKADGVVWDLMSGKIGVQTDDGIATLEGEGDDARVSVNMFDEFGIALPAFAQSTPIASVKAGDIIYRGSKGNIAWVIEVKGAGTDKVTFRVMKPNGEIASFNPPKLSMLGLDSGVMVLRSLMSMLPTGDKGLAGMQGMLMPLMLMGGADDGMLDKMMPMLLMGQMGGGDAGGMGNMMQMMLFMSMMKGEKSPFSGSTGGNKNPFANR